jgi:hypothetical protein
MPPIWITDARWLVPKFIQARALAANQSGVFEVSIDSSFIYSSYKIVVESTL